MHSHLHACIQIIVILIRNFRREYLMHVDSLSMYIISLVDMVLSITLKAGWS